MSIWQYIDASERVVSYTDENGAVHSALVTDASVQFWIAAGNTPAAPPALTLAQQAEATLAAGCRIASTGTPALDGTYAVDATSQSRVQAEMVSILTNGVFADGGLTVVWLDISGAAHTFTVAQFKTLATAVAAFVAGCLKVLSGQSSTLPAQPSSIT